DYNTWRSTFGQTGGGSGTTNNVGVMKRGYGTLTLSGANTYSGQLKVNDEGGTLRLTSVQTNAGQSMALPAVYIGNALNTTPTILKVLTNNALPANSLIRFGSGANGGINPIFRLHDEDPGTAGSVPASGSFNQTVRGFSGGNGLVQVGVGTLTIDTPTGESYSFSGTLRTDFDASSPDPDNPVRGTIIKTGGGRQDFTQTNGNMLGDFVLQDGTVGVGTNSVFGPVALPNVKFPQLHINGGTLVNTSGGPLNPSVQYIFVGGSFTFDINGGNDTQFNGAAGVVTTTLTADNPTITVLGDTIVNGSTSTGTLIFAGDIVDDGAPRGFTKSGPGTLTLGSPGNSYRGETTVAQGALLVRYQTNSGNTGTARIGDGNGRVNLSGGKLEYNGSSGSSSLSFTVTNPVRVTADSEIDYASATTGLTDATNPAGIVFDFASNGNGDAFDWTGGTLTFRHNGASQGISYRPSLSRSGFDYGGPVVIDNGAGSTRRTVLQSTNTSGSQTWSGAISGSGSFRRVAAGGATVFSGANTFTGGTFVDDGTLTVSGTNATFGGGNVTVGGATDGHAVIDSGVLNAIADTATLTLLGGGISSVADIGYIDLSAGIDEHVSALVLGAGSPITSGTWGSSTSSAVNKNDEYFSGTGIITVVPMGSGSSLANSTAAVPEPATLSLLMFAAGTALMFRRRRR
ncbi:MAG TPA: autotransporter-associated beta strand repeat-containing protein, partial [Lacipirellulaceae bacterium]|nr:autotransporter-associated beta strand repeat-containing protein [Lacipirellulaceae bacterium]